jgi:cell division protein FtsB
MPSRPSPKPSKPAAKPASGSKSRSKSRSSPAPSPARRAVPGSRVTGRTAVLGLLCCLLVLTLAYPAQEYLSQRQRIAQLEQDQSEQEKRIAELSERNERWSDPDYVRAQARERLQYVRPGEVAYVIVDESDPAAPARTGDGKASDRGPWYGRLWSSVDAADQPAQVPERGR